MQGKKARVPFRLDGVSLLLALLTTTAWGQPVQTRFVERQWSVHHGLPQVSVNAIAQTPDGYLWLGTNGGLVRFDGVRFRIYTPSNTSALTTLPIWALKVDSRGRLWVAAEGRVAWLSNGVFRGVDTPDDSDRRYFFEDPDGSMWVTSETYLLHFDHDLSFQVVHHFDNDAILGIARNGDGVLRVATHVGVFRGDAGGGLVRDLDFERRAAGDQIRGFFYPGSGAEWLLLRSGIQVVSDETSAADVNIIDGFVGFEHLLEDRQGRVWAGTKRGLLRMHLEKNGRLRAESIADVPLVQALVEDREGNLWAGSSTEGLIRVRSGQVHAFAPLEGSPRQVVLAIHEARDRAMWLALGCEGVVRLSTGSRRGSDREEDGRRDHLRREEVGCAWSLAEDGAGRVWIGTWGQGVYLWDDGRLEPAPTEPYAKRNSVVLAIYFDRRGAMWLGMLEQLVRVAPDGSHQIFTKRNGLPHDDVRQILETRAGDLWFATHGGLAKRVAAPDATTADGTRAESGRFRAYTAADGLAKGAVRALHEDSEGILWIGTYGGGLSRFENGRFTTYTTGDGLLDDTVSRILEDDEGRFWLSGNLGITAIPRGQLEAFHAGTLGRLDPALYTEADGMAHRETNGGFQPAGWKRHDGELWFPTQDGVAVVDPATLDANPVPPPVVIEEIRVDGEARPLGTDLLLTPARHNVEIDYTGLSFVDPENVPFRYRLVESGDAPPPWTEAGPRRTAFFTGLTPGDYRFEVIAANNDGLWSPSGASLRIVVPTPWWQTPWALVSGVALIFALAFGVASLRTLNQRHRRRETERLLAARTRELRDKTEQLTALDAAKSRFFANISHEFRTPLTLAMVPLEDTRRGRHGDLSEAATRAVDDALLNTRRLLRLVNQLLDVAKLEAGSLILHPQPLDLVALLNDLIRSFVPFAERKRLEVAVDLEPPAETVYLDPDQGEKIFINLLSNAFKFTPEGGQVKIRLRDTGDTVDVEIADTGPGIPPDQLPLIFDRFHQANTGGERMQPGTGIGLALANELARLHGGEIVAANAATGGRSAKGARFTVRLPTGRGHFEDTSHRVEDQPAPVDPTDAIARLPLEGEAVGGDEASARPGVEPEATEDRTTILIVDDNAEIRDLLRSQFEPAYRCFEAADGEEGLERARALMPDLVISDVMMPRTDGIELCRHLKRDPELDFIPVILLTAKAGEEDKLEGLGVGADDYLSKPFSPPELLARAENLIAQRRRLRDRLATERSAGGSRSAARGADEHPGSLAKGSAATHEDRDWLERLESIIARRLGDETFNVSALATAAAVDRSHLFRRSKALLGLTPSAWLMRRRLERAAQLLAEGAGNCREIGYAVGFKSLSHFTARFRERYGATPMRFAEENGPEAPKSVL